MAPNFFLGQQVALATDHGIHHQQWMVHYILYAFKARCAKLECLTVKFMIEIRSESFNNGIRNNEWRTRFFIISKETLVWVNKWFINSGIENFLFNTSLLWNSQLPDNSWDVFLLVFLFDKFRISINKFRINMICISIIKFMIIDKFMI